MVKTNFYQINKAVKEKKLSHSDVLSLALEKKALIDDNKDLLIKFINHVKKFEIIPSQLYQDVFASFIVGNKFDKTFLEFGATNGLSLSNSYALEVFLDWKGVLAEPDYKWFSDLKKNRPNTEIVTECVWSKSDEKLNFGLQIMGNFQLLMILKKMVLNFIKEM